MTKQVKVLAIASAGGHFVQLMRLTPAFKGAKLTVATALEGLRDEAYAAADAAGVERPDFHVITEANRWQKIKLLRSLLEITWLVARLRPTAIISTGAAPGYFAIWVGRFFGARTIWVDSIANAEELSLSGKKAGKIADVWLTQWEHLATPDGPAYKGSVV